MKLTMLGTGNALVTECYNICFVIEDGRIVPQRTVPKKVNKEATKSCVYYEYLRTRILVKEGFI